MANAPEFLTIYEVARRKMIPWAKGRDKVAVLFHSKKIQHIVVKQGKNKIYLTTPRNVKRYVRSELKGKI